jgi:hypothetical protein
MVRSSLNSNTTEVSVRSSGPNVVTEGPAYSRDITLLGDKKGRPETLITYGIVTATEHPALKAAATVFMKAKNNIITFCVSFYDGQI